MRVCPKCGFAVENDSAKFCKKCGNKLEASILGVDLNQELINDPVPEGGQTNNKKI